MSTQRRPEFVLEVGAATMPSESAGDQIAKPTLPGGMTITELREWSWLFDDDAFWEAISESRGGKGICTRRAQ